MSSFCLHDRDRHSPSVCLSLSRMFNSKILDIFSDAGPLKSKQRVQLLTWEKYYKCTSEYSRRLEMQEKQCFCCTFFQIDSWTDGFQFRDASPERSV